MLTAILLITSGLLPVIGGLWSHFGHKASRKATISWLRHEIARLESAEPVLAA